MLLNSASSTRAAEIGRSVIEEGHQRTVSEALSGPNAPQRAALVLALVAGFQVMRQSIGLRALAEGDPDVLVELLTPLFAQLVVKE